MDRWGVGQVPFCELSTHSTHAPAPLCCVALLVKYLICDSYLASIAMEECVGCLKIHSGRAAMRVLRPGAESRSCPGDERGGNGRDGGRGNLLRCREVGGREMVEGRVR